MLAAPMPGSSDFMLSEAVRAAAARGLVEPHDHIVCLMSVREDVVLKIVSVDSLGIGLKPVSGEPKREAAPHNSPEVSQSINQSTNRSCSPCGSSPELVQLGVMSKPVKAVSAFDLPVKAQQLQKHYLARVQHIFVATADAGELLHPS